MSSKEAEAMGSASAPDYPLYPESVYDASAPPAYLAPEHGIPQPGTPPMRPAAPPRTSPSSRAGAGAAVHGTNPYGPPSPLSLNQPLASTPPVPTIQTLPPGYIPPAAIASTTYYQPPAPHQYTRYHQPPAQAAPYYPASIPSPQPQQQQHHSPSIHPQQGGGATPWPEQPSPGGAAWPSQPSLHYQGSPPGSVYGAPPVNVYASMPVIPAVAGPYPMGSAVGSNPLLYTPGAPLSPQPPRSPSPGKPVGQVEAYLLKKEVKSKSKKIEKHEQKVVKGMAKMAVADDKLAKKEKSLGKYESVGLGFLTEGSKKKLAAAKEKADKERKELEAEKMRLAQEKLKLQEKQMRLQQGQR